MCQARAPGSGASHAHVLRDVDILQGLFSPLELRKVSPDQIEFLL